MYLTFSSYNETQWKTYSAIEIRAVLSCRYSNQSVRARPAPTNRQSGSGWLAPPPAPSVVYYVSAWMDSLHLSPTTFFCPPTISCPLSIFHPIFFLAFSFSPIYSSLHLSWFCFFVSRIVPLITLHLPHSSVDRSVIGFIKDPYSGSFINEYLNESNFP